MKKIYGVVKRAFNWESGHNTSLGNVSNLLWYALIVVSL